VRRPPLMNHRLVPEKWAKSLSELRPEPSEMLEPTETDARLTWDAMARFCKEFCVNGFSFWFLFSVLVIC
jgi:hypothetical protein